MTPAYATGADLFGSWLAGVERGEPPVFAGPGEEMTKNNPG